MTLPWIKQKRLVILCLNLVKTEYDKYDKRLWTDKVWEEIKVQGRSCLQTVSVLPENNK